MVRGGHGLLHAVDLHHHEDEGEEDHHEQLGGSHAEILADHEDRSGDWFRNDGEDCSIVDFSGEDVGGHKRRENRAAHEDRGQPDVHEHPLVVLQRKGTEGVAQHHENRRHDQNDQEHRLTDALEEGVPSDGQKLFEDGHGWRWIR